MFPLSYSLETFMKVWEKLWKHSPMAHVPTAFLVLPNFSLCFYNSIETLYMFFLFLNESNILLSVNIGLKLFMVVGVIGVNALMAIKLGFVTALPKQMEDYPVLVQTEDYAQ